MSKNRFGKFWNFDPWRLQFWPEPKNDRNDFEMIFRELSNAAFRFSLRWPGAEIMGGGVQTPPPPPAGGGKSRGPAGRGLISTQDRIPTLNHTGAATRFWCFHTGIATQLEWLKSWPQQQFTHFLLCLQRIEMLTFSTSCNQCLSLKKTCQCQTRTGALKYSCLAYSSEL